MDYIQTGVTAWHEIINGLKVNWIEKRLHVGKNINLLQEKHHVETPAPIR